jgi:hypothetical protein
MIFAHRLMQPEDIPEGVKIMASHPVFGPRYGREIGVLRWVVERTLVWAASASAASRCATNAARTSTKPYDRRAVSRTAKIDPT